MNEAEQKFSEEKGKLDSIMNPSWKFSSVLSSFDPKNNLSSINKVESDFFDEELFQIPILKQQMKLYERMDGLKSLEPTLKINHYSTAALKGTNAVLMHHLDPESHGENDQKLQEHIEMIIHFKEIMEAIESHLRDERNLLGEMLRCFRSYFLGKYSENLKMNEQGFINDEVMKRQVAVGIRELKEFMGILVSALDDFYMLDVFKKIPVFLGSYGSNQGILENFLFSKENYWNFILSMLLDPLMEDVIHKMLGNIYKDANELFNLNRIKFRECPIEKFEISPFFQLNIDTLSTIINGYIQEGVKPEDSESKAGFQKEESLGSAGDDLKERRFSTGKWGSKSNEKEGMRVFTQNPKSLPKGHDLEEPMEFQPPVANVIEIDNGSFDGGKGISDSFRVEPNNNKKGNGLEKYRPYVKGSIEDLLKTPSFAKSIGLLGQITKYPSPVQKLKLLVQVAESIVSEIDAFYDRIIPRPRHQLRGDSIVGVFLYVVSKCDVPNLPVQLKYISCFVPENVKTTIYGYYLATLQASIAHIMQEDAPENGFLKNPIKKDTEDFLAE